MQRLVALVPAPRANLTRYHGAFAPNGKWRRQIVPHRPQEQLELFDPTGLQPSAPLKPDAGNSRAALSARPDNYDWATLLRRVFQVDVTVCASCGGPAKLISAITDPAVIRKILKHLGLPAEPPTIGQGRGPPDRQLELLGVEDDDVA